MSQAAFNPYALKDRSGPAQFGQPFAGVIDPILVEPPARFGFAGCVTHAHALSAWQWVCRDLCADVIPQSTALSAAGLEAMMPQVLTRMREATAAADADSGQDSRLRSSLGSSEAREALPRVTLALRHRNLLPKAAAFGNLINGMADDAALGAALQSMPLGDPPLAALLFHAAMGQVANPTRIITTVLRLAKGATESAVIRAGFSPIVEAILAHAQNQLHVLQVGGPFADIDLVCHSIERFHRLMRALVGNVEFDRNSRWSGVIAGLIKQASDRIEPRLRDLPSDLNLAMRRGREGSDRLDSDSVLATINGLYLLRTVRECRDSLGLNAVFEQTWNATGQALELYLQRNLDLHRQFPDDAVIGARLDAAIKMVEIRFTSEYAETLRRARAAAERRA